MSLGLTRTSRLRFPGEAPPYTQCAPRTMPQPLHGRSVSWHSAVTKDSDSLESRSALIPGLCFFELRSQSKKSRIFAESGREHHANRQTIWRPMKRHGHPSWSSRSHLLATFLIETDEISSLFLPFLFRGGMFASTQFRMTSAISRLFVPSIIM